MIFMMDSVLMEFENMTRVCRNAKSFLKITHLEELKLNECFRFFEQNAPEFTAAKHFSIKRSLLPGILKVFVNFEVAIIGR